MLRALWAGVVISLAAFLLALVYFSRLTRLLAGGQAAARSPPLLAAYPFAAFFNAPYTEGLFLLGSVGAFYHFHQRRWLMASLFGLLVGLQPAERLSGLGAARPHGGAAAGRSCARDLRAERCPLG